MPRAWLALLLLTVPLAAAAVALPPASVGQLDEAEATVPGCPHVAGLGPACAVEGGYELVLADGTRLFTHGTDPVPGPAALALANAPPRDPPCVDDERDFHAHFIYAHPVDKPDRGLELTPSLRHLVAEANGLLYAEGAEFGAPVEYRFLCDTDGRPKVSIETIPVTTGLGDYTTLVNALRALGYVDPHAKYWVWYDDPTACPCGGIAAAPLDPERAPANGANAGGLFGATYGYFWALIPMHENGHNLGAVANGAPDTSGAGHCNDGQDIMCYADGGPSSFYTSSACADRMHFDCGHDTYFHPDPAPGTYVAAKWQIGAPIDRYVEGCHYAEDDIVLPTMQARVDVPASCAGHRYAIYGRMYAEPAHVLVAPPVRTYTNVFSLCWYADEALLSCPAQKPWGHEGRVPAGATHAMVTRDEGEDGRFTLSVI